nr:DUF4405 domain-containing protein [uncultured Carboxylicivirga sp.]
MRLSKVKFNFIVDILMFIVMMIVVGIGFLMEYVIIPGSQRFEVYGRNVELSFLGMDRHEWGNLHLILGLILIFLLVLHIIFHWKLILSIYRRIIPHEGIRLFLTAVLLILTVLFAIVPLFLKPDISEGGKHSGEHEGNRMNNKSLILHDSKQDLQLTKEHPEDHAEYDVEIYGSMTLQDVSEKYSIPVNELAEVINVPVSKSGERLGRLKKEYAFDMNDLRSYVSKQLKKN